MKTLVSTLFGVAAAALLALPPAQVHPVLRGLLSTDDVFVPQVILGS